jgi:hypothetical protein
MNRTTIIHHDFEMSPEEFEARKAWPIKGTRDWKGEYASQSPLNQMRVVRDGKGAEGTSGWLALEGTNSEQFYAEATPRWYRPRQVFDLRNTRATLYLKAITPITTGEGYRPYLFIDDYIEADNSYCGWFVNQPLQVGLDWTFNQVDLMNEETLWTRYSPANRSLDTVLSNVGFIGVMHFSHTNYTEVNATGILGIDEFRYNIPLPPK